MPIPAIVWLLGGGYALSRTRRPAARGRARQMQPTSPAAAPVVPQAAAPSAKAAPAIAVAGDLAAPVTKIP